MQPTHDVAIIGGGASGVLTAAQLHRRQPQLRVALIDSAGSWRGLAYGTPHDCHLLNVPAGNMSAFPDQPEHFYFWLRQRDPWAAKTTFAPRKLYGEYLAGIIEEACAAPGSRLEKLTGTAVSVEKSGAEWVVGLADGRTVTAKTVVLALGNLPPAEVPQAAGLSPRRYCPDPWAPGALDVIQTGVAPRSAEESGSSTQPMIPSARALSQLTKDDSRLPPHASVLLIGTGLTAIDVILALKANGQTGPIHALSRRGLLPQAHQKCEPWKLSEELVRESGDGRRETADSVLTRLKLLRREIKRAEQSGSGWRAVIDAHRPYTAGVWNSWPESEKRRFLRHLRAYWEVHRHRAAPEIAAQIEKLMATGLLQIHRGRIASMEEQGDEVVVRWRSSAGSTSRTNRQTAEPPNRLSNELELRVARVINCTGPACDYERIQAPLIVQMREAGLLVPDRLRLGIDTDAEGRMLDKSGKVMEGLWAVGPLRRARLWESTAMPEIRVQAEGMGGGAPAVSENGP